MQHSKPLLRLLGNGPNLRVVEDVPPKWTKCY